MAMAAVFGVVGAYAASRAGRQLAKESGHATMGRTYGRIRDGLVVAEVSLAFMLAIGAALVAREAIRLRSVPPGIVTDNVLTLHLTPRAEAEDYYAIEQRVAALSRRARRRPHAARPAAELGLERGLSRARARDGRPSDRRTALRHARVFPCDGHSHGSRPRVH